MKRYARDMRGYGQAVPDPQWPNEACLALQFVLNYEEGGENCLLHGDEASEAFLSEIVGASPLVGKRHWNMESIYEYGARAGFWRLRQIFDDAEIPVTVFGVATALARSPDQVAAMQASNWEIASHGLKWIEYGDFTEAEENQHMMLAIRLHEEVTGDRPLGWYTGRCTVNTVRLAAQEGGFVYVADSYADDLPYWLDVAGRSQLIVPYTLDANDMRFATAQGFNSGEQFFHYLKDTFDALHEEGMAGAPKMMSVGLHCRLAGRPGRAQALKRFIDYARSQGRVWFARRIDIARHWRMIHPPQQELRVPELTKEGFVQRYGAVFEHSEWLVEQAAELEAGPAHDSLRGVHSLLCRAFRAVSDPQRLAVLRAHPELAGKLAREGGLTTMSACEQASAGFEAWSEAERTAFMDLSAQYHKKFGFPFIIAVLDHNRESIMTEINRRIGRSYDAEFRQAGREVERIVWHRLRQINVNG